jgi:hypothetical protein
MGGTRIDLAGKVLERGGGNGQGDLFFVEHAA